MKLIERPKGLRVGTRVEIVASEMLNSRWVGYEGEIIKFAEPYDMAIVRITRHKVRGPKLRKIFWAEELKPLEEDIA